MKRQELIERILRHVYGEQPSQDSNITDNLVNKWINDGIGIAAKQNYKESLQLDGISYVNNSFYTTFKNLPIVNYEQFTYQMALPQIPFGVGKNEGIGSLTIELPDGSISYNAVPLSQNQLTYSRSLPPIPNRILYYSEGIFVYLISTVLLSNGYTGRVKMISGGDSTDLNSVLNVPDDYIDTIITYVGTRLAQERAQPKDAVNDGNDKA